jgi:CubicO group peptidase (beta-lactamase class C family)
VNMTLRKFRVGILLCSWCVFFGTAYASDPRAAELEKLYASGGDIPFLNGELLVAEKGRVVSRFKGGFAKFSTRTPLAADSIFQLASTAKIFTAVAILQLRDAELLALDEPVSAYLPEFKRPTITVRHLLTHTSGLPNLELYEGLVQKNPDHVVTGKDTLNELAKWERPLRFSPGEKFAYSNTNYVLLARVVEKISDMSFSQYLATKIFRPSSMDRTYTLADLARGNTAAHVANHARPLLFMADPEDVSTINLKDPRLKRRYRYELFNTGQTLGDQNVFTTVSDLLRFDQALHAGQILKLQTLREATTATVLNDGSTPLEKFSTAYGARCGYGLGWEVCDMPNGQRVMGHRGYNRGIFVMFYRNPTTEQTVIAYDNAEGAEFDEKIASVVNILNHQAPLTIDWRQPAVRVFGRTLVSDGPEVALIRYNEARLNTRRFVDNKDAMNKLGYDLLFNGYAPLSVEPFKLNLVRYPDDDNMYDSYGDALTALDRTAAAMAVYRQALTINPKNESAQQSLMRLEATQTERKPN